MKRLVDKKHLQRICEMECCLCSAPAIAHHLLRADKTRGTGRRAGDNYAINICHSCHALLHASGDEIKFFESNGWDYSRVIAHAKMLYEETLRNRL